MLLSQDKLDTSFFFPCVLQSRTLSSASVFRFQLNYNNGPIHRLLYVPPDPVRAISNPWRILRKVTPFFYFSKACILAWGASAARPYGGRAVLAVAFEAINNDKNSWPIPHEKLASIEKLLATQARIPPRVFRLGLVAICFGLVTFAIGVCAEALCFVENVFRSRPRWVQANICVLAGAAWPLYATLVTQARANRASSEDLRSKCEQFYHIGDKGGGRGLGNALLDSIAAGS